MSEEPAALTVSLCRSQKERKVFVLRDNPKKYKKQFPNDDLKVTVSNHSFCEAELNFIGQTQT